VSWRRRGAGCRACQQTLGRSLYPSQVAKRRRNRGFCSPCLKAPVSRTGPRPGRRAKAPRAREACLRRAPGAVRVLSPPNMPRPFRTPRPLAPLNAPRRKKLGAAARWMRHARRPSGFRPCVSVHAPDKSRGVQTSHAPRLHAPPHKARHSIGRPTRRPLTSCGVLRPLLCLHVGQRPDRTPKRTMRAPICDDDLRRPAPPLRPARAC